MLKYSWISLFLILSRAFWRELFPILDLVLTILLVSIILFMLLAKAILKVPWGDDKLGPHRL